MNKTDNKFNIETLENNLNKLIELQKTLSNNDTSSINVAFRCSCDC